MSNPIIDGVNVNDVQYDLKDVNLTAEVELVKENMIAVDDTQPSSSMNKIWINPEAEQEYTVPTYSEFETLSSALNSLPEEKESDADDVDLDITDGSGNVILRLADGHVQTKNFDSKDARNVFMEDDEAVADLDITDIFGNVVARFEDGHIKTKRFDSSDYDVVLEDVEQLQDDVDNLQSATSGILYRTMHQTDGVYAACRWHQPNSSSKQFCMLIAGDIHSHADEMERMIEYLNAVNAFDAGIMLGDMSSGTSASDISYYPEAISKANKPWLTLVGNHDVYDIASESALYARYMTPNIQYAQLAEGELVTGKCYYHKDFASYKIRIIVLMQYEKFDGNLCFGTDQINWFIQTLNSTPSDYGVIVAEHTNPSRYMTYNMEEEFTSSTWSRYNYAPTDMEGDPIPDIVNAWITGGTLTQSYAYTYENPPSPLSVSADFTSRGEGEFITYIGGHWHMDVLGYPTGYSDQPDYHVPAAGLESSTQGDMPRRDGTVSEDSFCAMAVDRDKKTVKIFHIGAHYTKDAVDRQFFKYSYGT